MIWDATIFRIHLGTPPQRADFEGIVENPIKSYQLGEVELVTLFLTDTTRRRHVLGSQTPLLTRPQELLDVFGYVFYNVRLLDKF